MVRCSRPLSHTRQGDDEAQANGSPIAYLGGDTRPKNELTTRSMINIRTKQLRAQLDALDLDAWARECSVDTGYTSGVSCLIV